jgi:hypothetical protein
MSEQFLHSTAHRNAAFVEELDGRERVDAVLISQAGLLHAVDFGDAGFAFERAGKILPDWLQLLAVAAPLQHERSQPR